MASVKGLRTFGADESVQLYSGPLRLADILGLTMWSRILAASLAALMLAAACYEPSTPGASIPDSLRSTRLVPVADEPWEALRGLSGVELIVEDLDPSLEEFGLRTSSVRTAVELELRRSGIPLKSASEQFGSKRYEVTLVVKARALKVRDYPMYVYDLDVRLHELDEIEADKPFLAQVVTWWAGETGYSGTGRLDELEDRLVDFAREFANDFLRANPGALGSGVPLSD